MLTMVCGLWLLGSALLTLGESASPRALITKNRSFVDPKTGAVVLLQGANVVMKGPPWLPPVTGDTVCHDRWFSNETCRTFNTADALHITKTNGWNFIRLGVVWAGGQPTSEPKLDDAWVSRLHDILDLCYEHG